MTDQGPRIGADQSKRYALGHSAEELERLDTQARIVDPVTRRFWTAAGVVPGMRVLDVGCGAGHTTVLLADMVGEHGQVVGIDNAAGAVAAAKALSWGRENVGFVHGDPTRHSFDAPFDAVVGRYVLMFPVRSGQLPERGRWARTSRWSRVLPRTRRQWCRFPATGADVRSAGFVEL